MTQQQIRHTAVHCGILVLEQYIPTCTYVTQTGAQDTRTNCLSRSPSPGRAASSLFLLVLPRFTKLKITTNLQQIPSTPLNVPLLTTFLNQNVSVSVSTALNNHTLAHCTPSTAAPSTCLVLRSNALPRWRRLCALPTAPHLLGACVAGEVGCLV